MVLVSAIWLFSACLPAAEPAARPGKTIRLLTVGNSFSQNATRQLGNLVTNAGHILIHQPIVVGGASLELHWGRAAAFEKDPTTTNGLYGKQSLKQHLVAQPWDFVTIQQASIKSHDAATYRPFAKQLHDYIKQHAPKAEVLMHQTWAYRVDDPRFKVAAPKAGEPKTQAEMYEQLTRAYTTIAAELGIRRLPVGDAFTLRTPMRNGPTDRIPSSTSRATTKACSPTKSTRCTSAGAGPRASPVKPRSAWTATTPTPPANTSAHACGSRCSTVTA